jgi:hypothetical protein
MSLLKANPNKRISKRYTYLPQARFESQAVQQGIQMRDISKSGLQFYSNALIRTNSPIAISWQDPGLGKVVPFLMVVRKIEQERDKIFRYCYGTQFFNLRQDAKLSIEKLVALTKGEEVEANKNLISKITVESLISIVTQGRAFLQGILKTEDELSKKFIRFTREVRDYERKAFDATDEVSQLVQKLTTHNFHCSLLNIAIPLIPKNHTHGFALYKEAVSKIQLITDINAEAKKVISAQVTESNNRLFYNKLELLQTFVDTYQSEGIVDNDQAVKKIVEEYNQTSPANTRTRPRR